MHKADLGASCDTTCWPGLSPRKSSCKQPPCHAGRSHSTISYCSATPLWSMSIDTRLACAFGSGGSCARTCAITSTEPAALVVLALLLAPWSALLSDALRDMALARALKMKVIQEVKPWRQGLAANTDSKFSSRSCRIRTAQLSGTATNSGGSRLRLMQLHSLIGRYNLGFQQPALVSRMQHTYMHGQHKLGTCTYCDVFWHSRAKCLWHHRQDCHATCHSQRSKHCEGNEHLQSKQQHHTRLRATITRLSIMYMAAGLPGMVVL